MKTIDDLASKIHACMYAYGQWPSMVSLDAARLIIAELNEIMPDGIALVESVDGVIQMAYVGKTVDVIELMPEDVKGSDACL